MVKQILELWPWEDGNSFEVSSVIEILVGDMQLPESLATSLSLLSCLSGGPGLPAQPSFDLMFP